MPDEAIRDLLQEGLPAGIRATRFSDQVKECKIIEVDAKPTQAYKRHRVDAVVGEVLPRLTCSSADFAKENVSDALNDCGFLEGQRLRMVARQSAPVSSIVLDYAVVQPILSTELSGSDGSDCFRIARPSGGYARHGALGQTGIIRYRLKVSPNG